VLANLYDLPRKFVPQYAGKRDGPLALIDLDITSADAAAVDLDQDFLIVEFRSVYR